MCVLAFLPQCWGDPSSPLLGSKSCTMQLYSVQNSVTDMPASCPRGDKHAEIILSPSTFGKYTGRPYRPPVPPPPYRPPPPSVCVHSLPAAGGPNNVRPCQVTSRCLGAKGWNEAKIQITPVWPALDQLRPCPSGHPRY